MRRDHVRFPGSQGAELVGRLERPDGEPVATALFAHCFTCGKDLKAAGWISRALVERGYAVLRFDFTGLGESEGEFAATDFSSNVADLAAAGEFLRGSFTAPGLLVGHSLGGAAVLAAAASFPEATAVATIGAPAATGHLARKLEASSPGAGEEFEVDLGGGRPFRVARALLDDLQEDHLGRALQNLGKALLLFHSPVDEVVPIDHARRLYEAARHPKSFVSLDGAHHLLWEERDARFLGEVLAAWAGRYVGAPEAASAEPAAVDPAAVAGAATLGVEEGRVVVTGGREGLVQRIVASGHRFTADEPVEVGGTGSGPTPYDLVLAGLGACTSMTLRLYAERKGWPLEEVRVALAHDRIHAADCATCEAGSARIDRIRRHLTLAGPLDEEQRARLLEIADRCPVHRTLEGEIRVETTT